MRYVSLCDGIGAAQVAWRPLGWQCAWVSEIEPFCCTVVDRRWNIENLGDMRKITDEQIRDRAGSGAIDLVCGGTPCQSFSVAGDRGGMADPRGNLALVFLDLVGRIKPRWVVWENVPGVRASWTDEATCAPSLSSKGGGKPGQGYPAILASGDAGPFGARRLTPRECETLMGFPQGYTEIRWGRPKFPDQICPDSPRYRTIGNSMPVPVMRWIGRRIEAVDEIVEGIEI